MPPHILRVVENGQGFLTHAYGDGVPKHYLQYKFKNLAQMSAYARL